jgi:hypothetical protein
MILSVSELKAEEVFVAGLGLEGIPVWRAEVNR